MKLPANAAIAKEKIVQYLLAKQPENDKSQFLAAAGYTIEQADRLADDLRKQILPLDAEFVETTEYGEKFRIRGVLTGPNGRSLSVSSIWMTEPSDGIDQVCHAVSGERLIYEIPVV